MSCTFNEENDDIETGCEAEEKNKENDTIVTLLKAEEVG